MEYALLPVLSLLLLWLLAGAALPFTVLADRRRAVTRRRSLYDKSADQISGLTWLSQVLLVLALAADLLAGGLVARLAVGPWRPVWLATVGACALAALFSLAGRAARRRRHAGGARVFTWLAGLCGVAAASSGTLFIWGFLRGTGLEAGGSLPTDSVRSALAAAGAVWGAADPALTAVFGLSCLTLAPATALGLGLCWQTLRRKADDFGRDYYTVTVGGRARRAAYAGALFLLFSALLLWLTPAFSPARLPFVLPVGQSAARAVPWGLALGCLGLPLAVLCWYLTARSAVPLRRKTLIFLAPVALWVGVYCLLARLWV